MKTPIDLTQHDVDRFAEQAVALHEWLEEEEHNEQPLRAIPPQLTAVAYTVLMFGATVLLDPTKPHSACWHAGCRL